MSNPKIATLIDGFTGTSINTTLWNNITAGAATLDQVNDLVVLAQPTVASATNTFGSTHLFDATGSSIYAEVGPVANGGGHTNTAFKVLLDANNSVAMRLQSGVFNATLQTAGTTVTTLLATTFDPNAYGWWRIREAGGVFYADVSADGFNWTNLYSSAYTWSATGVQFQFLTSATATEVAGNSGTLQHVNTMVGGVANLNWPVLEEAWAPSTTANGGKVPIDGYVNVTSRTRQQSSVSRGKQYEVDQVRSGEASFELENLDGALDPLNSAGPWYGSIRPYQPYKKRAQWPPTRNLLTQAQATGGDLGGIATGTLPSSAGIYSSTDATGGSIVSTASAWQGSSVLQFSVPSGTASQALVCYTKETAPEPGGTYTQTMQVRNVTASTSQPVAVFFATYNAAGTLLTKTVGTAQTLAGSTTANWAQVAVTATIDAATASCEYGLLTTATASATCSVQVDGWQTEEAATPSTWCCPGTWYPWFAGFFERWPSQWDMGGTYGTVQPTGVDAMALLSQVTLDDPLTQEIFSRTPRFLYTLGDPSNSSAAADSTGNNPPAFVGNAKAGAGSLTFGNQITAASTTGIYTGSTNSVVTINNPNPGVNAFEAASFISLTSAGITGPANPTTAWSRILAFRYTGPTPTGTAYLWTSFDGVRAANGAPGGSVLYWQIDNTGAFGVAMAGPAGSPVYVYTSGVNVCDSNWHLAQLSYSNAAGTFLIQVDSFYSVYSSVTTANTAQNLKSDSLGAYIDSQQGNYALGNYKGDMSFCAEFPFALATSDTAALYGAWLSAFNGESTNTRYNRILGYAGYTGAKNLQTGQTTSMGPMAASGQDALSALQAVVDTENGQHFIARDGTVTFQSRGARYNATVPLYTFGENTAAGEWPYEDAQLDFDPTHLGNIVQVTQEDSNQVFTAQDSTSQSEYFPRTMTRTVNASSPQECQDAANYLLSRYKQPATRISTLVLHPAANPAMWPVCLSLELGMRIRVNRRPPAAPPITVDCFVENLQWTNDDQGEAFLTLQCSPVDLTPYGIFASFHTTLNASIASNVGSFVIHAGADTTNPAAAQIGYGQQLVLGLGTANQETVTVKSVSVTTSGWSTATITLQANTTKSHTAGDTVCEPLPAGVTSASAYDAPATFDSVAFSY